jgi:hypothetical protein
MAAYSALSEEHGYECAWVCLSVCAYVCADVLVQEFIHAFNYGRDTKYFPDVSVHSNNATSSQPQPINTTQYVLLSLS